MLKVALAINVGLLGSSVEHLAVSPYTDLPWLQIGPAERELAVLDRALFTAQLRLKFLIVPKEM